MGVCQDLVKKKTKCPQFANKDVDKMRVCVQEKVVNVLLLHRRGQNAGREKEKLFPLKKEKPRKVIISTNDFLVKKKELYG